ncbi:hypothetical protein DDZ16_19925 [Marinilabilia rubra]|uniref:Uncharacterized protein n=1 Tax=Marinilabilia rubra TaxID=2162893 RepID=A0A2U2B3G8_9BACT|nr:hypothetical protein DDZ16_19925 [Marinilabilia rubra]
MNNLKLSGLAIDCPFCSRCKDCPFIVTEQFTLKKKIEWIQNLEFEKKLKILNHQKNCLNEREKRK